MDFSFGSIMSSLAISSLGLGLFLYGKKSMRMVPLSVGLALMIFPYFVTNPVWAWVVTGVLMAPVVALRNA